MPHGSWILASFAMFAAATLLLSWSLRGRRVNDHRVCRRCGYDLLGLPAGSEVCSECGTNLKSRRAVRIGSRERRRGALAVALCLLLLSAGSIVFLGRQVVRVLGPDHFKPVWWLLHD